MEYSSMSKLGRQSLVSARSKGRNTDIVRRGINPLADSARRHEFSLDSLDKEILQTMSRGSKNGHVSLPSDSTSESSGSAQEKAICSSESPHPEPVPHGYVSPEYKRHQKSVMQNGLHSSESTPKISKKPTEQYHSSRHIGQFHAPALPMCPEADVHPNGHRQQVSVNVNGSKHQQDPGHWHHSGGALHHSGGNNEMHVSHRKELPFRDAHYVICNQDAELSSNNSGEDNGEETRRKQASEGPYSGSIGGRSQQRSALKYKVSKTPSSKWDDADKWIASPGHNDSATLQSTSSSQGSAPSPLLVPGKRLTVTGQVVGGCNELDSSNVATPRVDSSFSLNSNGITSTVNVKDHIQQIESVIQNSLVKSPPISDLSKRREAPRVGAKCVDVRPSRSDLDNKRGDTSIITSTIYIQRPKDSRVDDLISPQKLQTESQVSQNPVSIPPTEKPPLAETPTDAPVKDIFSNGPHSRSASDFPSSISVRESGTETAQPSALYRDMGTQMTPNPSVRLSRGETLGAFHISPSRHNTPDHSRRTASVGAPANADILDIQNFHTDKLGRRIPSSQPHPTLDRSLNWSTREEEEAESATCLRAQDGGETQSRPFVAWALAWEEAEHAKYTARFHQEEARIKAWEELQKGKAEARMRKTEAKLEKLHESASQKMSNQIAAINRKAEDMRAAAEAFRDELATKAKHRAEYIRQTGNVPTTMALQLLGQINRAPPLEIPQPDEAFEKLGKACISSEACLAAKSLQDTSGRLRRAGDFHFSAGLCDCNPLAASQREVATSALFER